MYIKQIGCLIIAFCSFLSISLSSQENWIRFKPPGQTFEVSCPGEMKNGEKKILTEIGTLQPVTWLYQGLIDDPNYLYLISYIDYENGTFHHDSISLIKELLDVSVEVQTKTLSGELVYKSENPHGTYPGILYRATYNNNKAVVKGRMILIRDRLYILQVYTLSEKSLNLQMDKFLNSFKSS